MNEGLHVSASFDISRVSDDQFLQVLQCGQVVLDSTRIDHSKVGHAESWNQVR